MNKKMSRYNCGNCKYYDSDESYCEARGEPEIYPLDSCESWTDPNSPDEPTEEEKREIIGDFEAHRRMVEGDDVL